MQVYEEHGDFDKAAFDSLWRDVDPEETGVLRIPQVVKLIYRDRNIYDIVGVSGAILEWGLLFLLCANSLNNFTISKEDVLSQYDGTLFSKIEKKRLGIRVL